MGQPAEMVHGFADRTGESDLDLGLHRPLTARKAIAVWMALSAIGWAAIIGVVSLTLL